MKKIFLFISLLALSFSYAQDVTDALRYSNQQILGTARYRSMAGAFGALGGDISALHINPAGSAVFTDSYGAFTLGSTSKQNDIFYRNDLVSNNETHWNFNQVGAVFLYERKGENQKTAKIAAGISYHQTADFRANYQAVGTSNTSITSYFLEEANGIPLNQLEVAQGQSFDQAYANAGQSQGFGFQQALLGYEALLFDAQDPDNAENTAYITNTGEGSYNQDYLLESSGTGGLFTFNISGEFFNSLYIGANLNSHFIRYIKNTSFLENNQNSSATIREIDFRNNLRTDGTGLSAQFGAIYKFANLRVGLSVDTPTIMILQEEITQSIDAFSSAEESIRVAPDVINTFPEYQLTTPGKITGSLAFLFGKSGLISVDYALQDFSSIRFDSDEGVDFSEMNASIANTFKESSTFKIGGEYRVGNLSYRAGYRYIESPYQNENLQGNITGIALGLGYSYGKWRFDMAYDSYYQDREEQFYPNSGFTNVTFIENYTSNITFTLGLHL